MSDEEASKSQRSPKRESERPGDDHSADGEGDLGTHNQDVDQAQRIFKSGGKLPEGNHSVASMHLDPSRLFSQAIEQTRMAIALTDPHLPDNPLIFVNKAFEVMTGYDRKEVIGRNCRFLQTERTSQAELDRLRRGLANEDTIVVEIENRRKDGSTFVNALHVGPIYDENGRLTHFYGSQWNVSELVEKRTALMRSGVVAEELEHRIGNLFTVVSSIVRLSGRGETDVQRAIDKANERILALARAHSVSSKATGPDGEPVSLHDLVEVILKPYRLNAQGRIVLGGKPVELPPRAITPLGLALHELATNAVKYGALADQNGRVQIEWTLGDCLKLVWEEEGGTAVTQPRDGHGTGTRILEGVMSNIDADISFHWRSSGVRVTITMPLDETPLRT